MKTYEDFSKNAKTNIFYLVWKMKKIKLASS